MSFFRFLLFPFSAMYGWVMAGRNLLYDEGLLATRTFPVPVIGVGNLTVGGTGKTPHVEYLLRLLKGRKLATLSRGYGRQTKGFLLADEGASSAALGDEPFQYFLDSPGVAVAVCEDRVKGIAGLLGTQPDTEVIVLDDAFQHRSVQPSLNILITDYGRLFHRDFVVPAGLLREHRQGAIRAQAVIVSKCPDQLQTPEMDRIEEEIKAYATKETPVFFSTYRYGDPVGFGQASVLHKKVILMTGIANPGPIQAYLKQTGYTVVEHLSYRDHYPYTPKDLEKLKSKIMAYQGEDLSVITTRKDAVRLLDSVFQPQLKALPMFYLPIAVTFLRAQEHFDHLILSHVGALTQGQIHDLDRA
jgi:tetraacyldisaccharide 4'-kinase